MLSLNLIFRVCQQSPWEVVMGADRKTTPGTLGNDTRTLLQTPEDLLTPWRSQSGLTHRAPLLTEPVVFLLRPFWGSHWFKLNFTLGIVESFDFSLLGNWSKLSCLLKKRRRVWKKQGWGSLRCGVRTVLEEEGLGPSKFCSGKPAGWSPWSFLWAEGRSTVR